MPLEDEDNSQISPISSFSFYKRLYRIRQNVHAFCDKKTSIKKYAIKVYGLEDLSDIEFDLLIHEIHMCQLLRHQNLVQHLTSFVNQNQVWIVMPLYFYTSIDTFSKPNGLPELAIAYVVRDILSALEYLHNHGVIHRSVKASNIFVNETGRCHLGGLKNCISCISRGSMQQYLHEYPKKAKQNINWFSPEILEQNLFGYNNKSDIYSLGITCCELGNGIVPYSDLQPTEMLLDKLTGYAPRLLDKTCNELEQMKLSEMTEDETHRYQVFSSRQFSTSFHRFTSDLCLNFDPQKRPCASKLLQHCFVKQLKKCPSTSLRNFLDISSQAINEPNSSGTSSNRTI